MKKKKKKPGLNWKGVWLPFHKRKAEAEAEEAGRYYFEGSK